MFVVDCGSIDGGGSNGVGFGDGSTKLESRYGVNYLPHMTS